MGFYYPHSLCPILLQVSESRCPNQMCKTQTRFLTKYRLKGHNLEIERRRQLFQKPQKGQIHQDGTGDVNMGLSLGRDNMENIFF